jgi:hypothetical protein
MDVNAAHHAWVLAELQRLRGSVYLRDGAIEPSHLSSDGRHVLDVDRFSWHVVSLRADGRVTGCARYRAYGEDVRPEDLGVWNSALARSRQWQRQLRAAVENEMNLARRRNVGFVEVGGWAVTENLRFTIEALQIALSTYALARTVGGSIGLTTATVRHCSSRILRKIGGRSLELAGCPLPSYYDPQYKCEMEILRFDSSAPTRKFEAHVQGILSGFSDLPVVCATGKSADVAAAPRHARTTLPHMAAVA